MVQNLLLNKRVLFSNASVKDVNNINDNGSSKVSNKTLAKQS